VELSIGPTPESTSSPESRGLLGNGPDASHQLIVPAGAWQTARALEGPVGHALVGCVVAPGFDFADFEILD
jgi:predicted cupin superfamily sugar epimerase